MSHQQEHTSDDWALMMGLNSSTSPLPDAMHPLVSSKADPFANQGMSGSHTSMSQQENADSVDWALLMGLNSSPVPLPDTNPPAMYPNVVAFDPFANQGTAESHTSISQQEHASSGDWALMMGLNSSTSLLPDAIRPVVSPNPSTFDPLTNQGRAGPHTNMPHQEHARSGDWTLLMGYESSTATLSPVSPKADTTMYQAEHPVGDVACSDTTLTGYAFGRSHQDSLPSNSHSFVRPVARTVRSPSPQPVTREHRGMQDAQQGYRFGDLTRSVISKGKKKDGRNEKDGYKFGDFTRGLFG
jgi:hypothetical protein